jgi:hypothetical protein
VAIENEQPIAVALWKPSTTKNIAGRYRKAKRVGLTANTVRMSRLIIGLLFTILLLSCKKEQKVEITESEIVYEMNGVPFQLKSKTDITFDFGGIIQTTGSEKPTNRLVLRTPNLNIRVYDYTNETPISTGTYSSKTYDNDGNLKGVELYYTNDINEFYESAFAYPDTEVTITSISRNGVKGTFRGVFFHNQDTLTFENGSFSIYTYHN